MTIGSNQTEYKATWGRAGKRAGWHGSWYYVRLLLLALALAFVIKESVVEAYRIPSIF